MRTKELPRAMPAPIPSGSPPEAPDVRPTRIRTQPIAAPLDAQDLPPAMTTAKPRLGPPADSPSPRANRESEPRLSAPESSAIDAAKPRLAPPRGDDEGGRQRGETHSPAAPSVYLQLRVWSEMFEDAQKSRIGCSNRIERGGVDSGPYLGQLAAMEAAEHSIGLGMRRCYRANVDPRILVWQKNTRGIGEHLLARLIGLIGHPVHTTAHHWEGSGEDRELIEDGPLERSVSQLWSYCGHGDVTRKRRTGMTAEEAAAMGNPRAKMIVHLIAESVVKARGPHRVYYDERRLATVDRGWTPGHSHNDALRILGKAILKDLWIASGGPEVGEGVQNATGAHWAADPLAFSYLGQGLPETQVCGAED